MSTTPTPNPTEATTMFDYTFDMDPDSDGQSVDVFRADTGFLAGRVDLFAGVFYDMRNTRRGPQAHRIPDTITTADACEAWATRILNTAATR